MMECRCRPLNGSGSVILFSIPTLFRYSVEKFSQFLIFDWKSLYRSHNLVFGAFCNPPRDLVSIHSKKLTVNC